MTKPDSNANDGSLPRRIVVFRHGILLNRFFMVPMERFFRARGYDVRNRSYPSTRLPIEEHAQVLHSELVEIVEAEREAGRPEPRLYAVTHSMGGLVLRYALTRFPCPPLARAVEIVPPNHGSRTARHFRRFPPFRWLYGRHAGAQLAENPPGIFEKCGIPEGVEIGIIAGTGGVRWHLAPLPGPHDGIVALEEARLEGCELIELPYGHTPILFRRRAWELAVRYLEEGTFEEPPSRGARADGASPESPRTRESPPERDGSR